MNYLVCLFRFVKHFALTITNRIRVDLFIPNNVASCFDFIDWASIPILLYNIRHCLSMVISALGIVSEFRDSSPLASSLAILHESRELVIPTVWSVLFESLDGCLTMIVLHVFL